MLKRLTAGIVNSCDTREQSEQIALCKAANVFTGNKVAVLFIQLKITEYNND